MPEFLRAPQPVGEYDLMAIGPVLLAVLVIIGIRKLWSHWS
ncbi:hypothetical protein LCGC14_0287710 [marine sediment metagenome]|uniref:Uncharacterized protein n=1 Tax=marine sediment metagenome TaxID=412755 RepID=A0A0F9TTX7_9ZZZZ